jgi:hypothetical protein
MAVKLLILRSKSSHLGRRDKAKVHVKTLMTICSPNGRTLRGLFPNASLSFEVDKTKGVIFKHRGDASSILW